MSVLRNFFFRFLASWKAAIEGALLGTRKQKTVPWTAREEEERKASIGVGNVVTVAVICLPFRALAALGEAEEGLAAGPRGPTTTHSLRRLLLWREAIMRKAEGERRDGREPSTLFEVF